jgi:hypothetical protein
MYLNILTSNNQMANHHAVPVAVPIDYNTAMMVPQSEPEITDKMLECFSLRKTVKFLSAVDIFFGLLYSINNPWFIFPTFISLIGYYGAKKYNHAFILSYFLYITLDWIVKLGLYIYIATNPVENSRYSTSAFSWTVVVISTLIDIWISKIVFKFWRCLRNMPVLELQNLREMNNIKYRIVYW